MTIKTTQLVVLTQEETDTLMKASNIIQKIYYDLNLNESFKFEDEDVADSINEIADFLRVLV